MLTGTTAGVSDSRVSSQRRLWNWLHVEAPDLIAPDVRGRADGVAISGPFSLAQHVDDLIMILDELEIDSIHICGMSMGRLRRHANGSTASRADQEFDLG